MTIQYQIGDATQPTGIGTKIIVHICNDAGLWGCGFVLALSRRWPQTRQTYLDWFHTGLPKPRLGQVQFVTVQENLIIANLIGQSGVRSETNPTPISYDAVQHGLNYIGKCAFMLHASIHMPRIGCGLAGGSWNQIEPIIQTELIARLIPVTVYDLPEQSYSVNLVL